VRYSLQDRTGRSTAKAFHLLLSHLISRAWPEKRIVSSVRTPCKPTPDTKPPDLALVIHTCTQVDGCRSSQTSPPQPDHHAVSSSFLPLTSNTDTKTSLASPFIQHYFLQPNHSGSSPINPPHHCINISRSRNPAASTSPSRNLTHYTVGPHRDFQPLPHIDATLTTTIQGWRAQNDQTP